VGIWNYIRQSARDGLISAITAYCICGYTGSVNTIAASPHESPLAIDSLLDSLIDSLLERAALRVE
jgi:hypothetical protein